MAWPCQQRDEAGRAGCERRVATGGCLLYINRLLARVAGRLRARLREERTQQVGAGQPGSVCTRPQQPGPCWLPLRPAGRARALACIHPAAVACAAVRHGHGQGVWGSGSGAGGYERRQRVQSCHHRSSEKKNRRPRGVRVRTYGRMGQSVISGRTPMDTSGSFINFLLRSTSRAVMS